MIAGVISDSPSQFTPLNGSANVCDETATLGAEAMGTLKRAKRGALASRVGDVTLGTAARRATAHKRVRIVVRISKRYRRALAKGTRIRVVLHATDALGNRSDVSRKVRIGA